MDWFSKDKEMAMLEIFIIQILISFPEMLFLYLLFQRFIFITWKSIKFW